MTHTIKVESAINGQETIMMLDWALSIATDLCKHNAIQTVINDGADTGNWEFKEKVLKAITIHTD